MSETKNPGEKKLSVSGKTLTLKPRTETGVVRQSFSHGRSKQVVVEKVKRRVVGGPSEAKAEAAPATEAKKAPVGKAGRVSGPGLTAGEAAGKPKPSGVVLRTLTEEERTARAHALADSRVREAEERRIAEEGKRKLAAALRRKTAGESSEIAVIDAFSGSQLDLALNRPNVVHAALLAGPGSETFLARVTRLMRFRTGNSPEAVSAHAPTDGA